MGIFGIFGFLFQKGRVAERLGRGLQNLVQRFESARDLKQKMPPRNRGHFYFAKRSAKPSLSTPFCKIKITACVAGGDLLLECPPPRMAASAASSQSAHGKPQLHPPQSQRKRAPRAPDLTTFPTVSRNPAKSHQSQTTTNPVYFSNVSINLSSNPFPIKYSTSSTLSTPTSA